MRILTGLLVVLSLAGWAHAQDGTCVEDRTAFAVQDYETFNASAEGWQRLAYSDCYIEAAEAISDWYRANAASLDASQVRTLSWNGALMRAAGGDYRSAIFLFQQTFPERGQNAAEHYYTYAMIAFLERDRDGLQRIRDAMASMPEPEGGVPAGESWPPNLASVDLLLTCYDSAFAEAIVGGCLPE